MSIIEPINPAVAVPSIKAYLLDLQNRICNLVEKADGEVTFLADSWEHESGGGGLTRALTNGPVIEKAGVNFSHVYGNKLPPAATQKRPQLNPQETPFQALGVSVVIHPRNPFVPTTHANVRFILVEKAGQVIQWWFGGGFDLTPYYGFMEDCQYWHEQAKLACEPFGDDIYLQYKNWCDEYFYLRHRHEPRGIGGIFYDDLNNLQDKRWTFEQCFAFMRSVGDHFIEAYQPIVERRKNHPFTEQEREFQAYRRGRYVEFNLLYDRGTLFGLQSGGRTESILMSLPPQVSWRYNWRPKPASKEAELYDIYLKPRKWT